MPSEVFFGSAHQAHLDPKESLPAKLDLILERLHLRDRVKDEVVAIKMHLGNGIGYSTVHPIFLGKVVQAVKDGGGKPFITDLIWDVRGAETRGYTSEVLGCPICPTAGWNDKYYYSHERPYKNIREWKVAGMVEDATFLINFAHVKGHPSCGFGAAIKNIAIGCMIGETRGAIHDCMHHDRYWFPEYCPDDDDRKRIIESCPHQALVQDKENPNEIHLHFEQCNQCGRCLHVAPQGSLKIDPVNFHVFQEACAISTSITLSTFEPAKMIHLNLATHMTPVCDCFGFTGLPILADTGIFGSNDIVALDHATLDNTGHQTLIEENVPTFMEVHTRKGHPFHWLHGPLKDPYLATEFCEQLGIGSRDYHFIDVLPVEEIKRAPMPYIPAE